jgi:hypothetical protein
MAEWLKATDCKSVLSRVRRFETYSAHKAKFANMPIGKCSNFVCSSFHLHIGTFAHLHIFISGSSSFGRAVAFQASGGQFEPGLPLIQSAVSSWQQAIKFVANCNLPTAY